LTENSTIWLQLSLAHITQNKDETQNKKNTGATGRAKKSNPLGKIRYPWNCSRFLHQIYGIYIATATHDQSLF